MFTIVSVYSAEAVTKALEIAEQFTRASGLAFNLDKTLLTEVNCSLDTREELRKEPTIKILGVWLDARGRMMDRNWTEKFQKLKSQISFWRRQYLTIKGRIIVSKAKLAPIFNHLAFIPDTKLRQKARQCEAEINLFVWNMSHKMKIDDSSRQISRGGLGLLRMWELWESLACTWIGGNVSSEPPKHAWQESLRQALARCSPGGIDRLSHFGFYAMRNGATELSEAGILTWGALLSTLAIKYKKLLETEPAQIWHEPAASNLWGSSSHPRARRIECGGMMMDLREGLPSNQQGRPASLTYYRLCFEDSPNLFPGQTARERIRERLARMAPPTRERGRAARRADCKSWQG